MNEILNLIPNPDPLPVASFWFFLLSYLTYYLHLVSTGIMIGVSIMAAVGYLKGKNDSKWKAFSFSLSKILPFMVAFTVNLGVAPLLFIQVLYGNFFYSASIILAIPWIFIFILLIISYYLAYWLVFRKNVNIRYRLWLSVMVSLVFIWIAFILVNVNTLMLVPKKWQLYFSSMMGLNLNLSESTLFPRFVFFLLIFIAIGGIFVAFFYRINNKKEEAKIGFHFGSLVSGYFSLLSIPAFLLWLFKLPVEIRNIFWKMDMVWTSLAVIFIFGLLFLGYLGFKRKTIISGILMTANLIIFVFIRNHIRFLYLKPFEEKLSKISQNTQYDLLVLFLVIFLLGVGLIYWLLKKKVFIRS